MKIHTLIWRQSILKYNYRMAQTTQWSTALLDYRKSVMSYISTPLHSPPGQKRVGWEHHFSNIACGQLCTMLARKKAGVGRAHTWFCSFDMQHRSMICAWSYTFLVKFKIHYKVVGVEGRILVRTHWYVRHHIFRIIQHSWWPLRGLSHSVIKFMPASGIELSKTAICVQLCTENECKRPTLVADLTNFPFEYFMPFSHNIPLYLLNTSMQSQKWAKTQIKGGGGGEGVTA